MEQICKKRVGIVADDITGSNDIGIMFAKNGYTAGVYQYNEGLELTGEEGMDVYIIDTDSRLDDMETAYSKVFDASLKLKKIGCDLYFKKTCSVFRGNIGVEFDAMQDALGIKCSAVILGFPKNGRTTVNGIHYLNGQKIEDSQFRNDPIHPMVKSGLADIISEQSCRSCTLVDHTILDRGSDYVHKKYEELSGDFNYIIFDVRSQKDLTVIAKAISGCKMMCGSSAIGEELPGAWHGSSTCMSRIKHKRFNDNEGVLLAAGSLTPQTAVQIEYCSGLGIECLEIDIDMILKDGKTREEHLKRLVDKAACILKDGRDVLVHTPFGQQKVDYCKKIGREKGLGDIETGKEISSALASAVSGIMEASGCRKLVVAGGETSAAVSEALEIEYMVIADEIEPGLPNIFGFDKKGNEYLMVLKSGSFGSAEFLKKAADNLIKLQHKILQTRSIGSVFEAGTVS